MYIIKYSAKVERCWALYERNFTTVPPALLKVISQYECKKK